MSSSSATTRDIRIEVQSQFVPDRSQPERHHWFFLYRVRIANLGQHTVQLRSRHWVITDANGKVEEVRGPGVVGEEPILAPGEGFEYTSASTIATSFGIMHGTYQMETEGGDTFDAEIAPFQLGEATVLH